MQYLIWYWGKDIIWFPTLSCKYHQTNITSAGLLLLMQKIYCITTTIKTCLLNFETYLTHSAVYVALYSEAIFLDSARAAIQLVSSWEKRRLTSKIFPTAATADKIEIPLLLLLENWMLNLRIDVLNTPCSFKFLKWWKL